MRFLLNSFLNVKKRTAIKLTAVLFSFKGETEMKRKWTKESATNYIKYAKEKGLTYWSAKDFLKNHRVMHSII